MIVLRYLIKEVFQLMCAVLIVVTVITLADQVIKLLTDVAHGHLSLATCFQLIILYIPYLLTYLLPFALYLSIMIGYGRLYSDNEMVILFSYGLSYTKFYLISFLQIFVIACFVGSLSLWAMPQIKQMRRNLKKQSVVMLAMIQSLRVGEMDEMPDHKGVVYIGGKEDKTFKDVFMSLKMPSSSHDLVPQWQTVLAKTAYPTTIREKGLKGYYFAFNDGHAYWGHPGESNYRMMSFKQYGIHLYEETDADLSIKDAPSKRLFQIMGTSNEARGELSWRLAQPISTIILGLMALNLCQIDPRRGKFSKIIPGILLYIIYLNTMLLIRSWITGGRPVQMWWLHLAMLTGVILYAAWNHFSRYLQRRRRG